MLNIAFFSSKSYDEKIIWTLQKANSTPSSTFADFRLTTTTAKMAHDNEVVCAFVNDDSSRDVLEILSERRH